MVDEWWVFLQCPASVDIQSRLPTDCNTAWLWLLWLMKSWLCTMSRLKRADHWKIAPRLSQIENKPKDIIELLDKFSTFKNQIDSFSSNDNHLVIANARLFASTLDCGSIYTSIQSTIYLLIGDDCTGLVGSQFIKLIRDPDDRQLS